MINAIYYSRIPKGGEHGGYLYVDHPQWRNYPHELLGAMRDAAGTAVVVCKEDTYLGDNTFSSYWLPSGNETGYFECVNEPITVDAIFDKGHFSKPATFSLVNAPDMRLIGRDKSRQYDLFGELQPFSRVVSTGQLSDTIDSVPGDKVVIKPLNLNGGKGIIIASKSEAKAAVNDLADQEWIVQQFIDSSKGISDLLSGVHDLRLYIIDGEAVLASVRQPKEGSLIANTSQGGTINFFAVGQIPSVPIEIAKKVDESLSIYGNRYYSVDFITDGENWYVLEINDRPGVPATYQSEHVGEFHRRLAQCIADSSQNPLNKQKNTEGGAR